MNSLEKMSVLHPEDIPSVMDALDTVAGRKEQGEKCTIEIRLKYGGSAKIYHMGAANPVIRVDIKGV